MQNSFILFYIIKFQHKKHKIYYISYESVKAMCAVLQCETPQSLLRQSYQLSQKEKGKE